VTGRVAADCEKGVQVAWKFGASCSSERPIPADEAGIEPIEGVLDREIRGLKRYAGGAVLARTVATSLERMATRLTAASMEYSPVAVRRDRGRQILRWYGRPFQPKGAGGQDAGEIPRELTPTRSSLWNKHSRGRPAARG
jgi:hypothetical protein